MLLLGFLFVVQFPAIQKQMAQEFSKWIAEEYDIHLESDKIKLSLLSGLEWEDVLVKGANKDTLIYVEEVKIQTSNLRFNQIKKVYLEGLYVNYQYRDSLNDAELYKYLQPFLTSEKNNGNPLEINHIWINDGRIDIGNAQEQRSFRNLDLYLKEGYFGSDTHFNLSNIEWEQWKGQKHEAKIESVKFAKNAFQLNGVHWMSGNSTMHLDYYSLNKKSTLNLFQVKLEKSAMKGLIEQWPENLDFNLSSIVHISGDSLWSEKTTVSTSKGSKVVAGIEIQNWKNFHSWKYNIQANQFDLNNDEWFWIESLFNQNYLMSKLGWVKAKATLRGTLSDLDLQLDLTSNLGELSSDLFVDISDSLEAPVYHGDLVLSNFNLAPLVQKMDIGFVDAKAAVTGSGFDLMSFDTEIHGQINSIATSGYTYENIKIDGRLQPNHFKGNAIVSDKNLEVNFSGEIDFSKQKPIMDFEADIIEADLVQLNWYDKTPVANLSSLVKMNFEGNNWNNIEGDVGVYFTTVETYDHYYHFNDMLFSSEKFTDKDVLKLESDFANANFEGQIDIPNLFNSFFAYLSPHFPLLNKGVNKAQDFTFTLNLFNTSSITDLLLPELKLGNGAQLSGSFNNRKHGLQLNFESPNLGWGKWLCRDFSLNSRASTEHWEIGLSSAKLDFNNATKIENLELDQIGNYGDWRYAFAWTSNDSIKYDGIVKGMATVDNEQMNVEVEESKFYFADSLWSLNEASKINYRNHYLQSNIQLSTSMQSIALNYEGSKEKSEMGLEFQNFDFENLSPWLSRAKTELKGFLSGEFMLKSDDGNSIVNSKLTTNHLYLNDYLFGALDLNVIYDEPNETQQIQGGITKYGGSSIEFDGAFMPNVDSNNFAISVDVLDFDIRHLETYLDALVSDVEGNGQGVIHFYGELNEPEFEGEIVVDGAALSVPYLNIDFEAIDNSIIQLSDRHINFKEFDFVSVLDDAIVGHGDLSGDVLHHYFKDISLDLAIHADSLLCLNTDAYQDEAYYGKAIASGDARFTGPTNSVDIKLNAKSKKGTNLFIPLDEDESIEELSFIHFIDKKESIQDSLWTLSDIVTKKTLTTVDLNLEVDENAEVNIIFDETLGDKIQARGNGFLNLGVNSSDEVYMFGDYTVEQGDYLFTLQNFANKKFEIEKGAQLLWDGDPYKAEMNLSAIYKVNTNIRELASEYNRNTEVECRMLMTGDLLQPDIKFDIQIPKGDDMIKRILDERTNTEEKKTQQFLSLLVLNNFMSADELENTDVDYLSSTLSTGTEVLSNQLSNWMSQFTDRVDVGFKYQPNQGDTLTNKEFELLLNNMKVNDRITVNGNIGTQAAQNNTRVIGDFKVEYFLNESGKLRLLAFRNLEESFQLQNDVSNYTTGLGLFYRDEFEDVKELWQRIKNIFNK